MQDLPETWRSVGRIGMAQALKGEVRVYSEMRPPESLFDLPLWGVSPAWPEPKKLNPMRWRLLKKPWFVVQFEQSSDRNEAEKWRDVVLMADRHCFPPLPSGQLYPQDVIHLPVFLVDASNHLSPEPCATVIAMDHFGAGDLLLIQPLVSNDAHSKRKIDSFYVSLEPLYASVILEGEAHVRLNPEVWHLFTDS